jgi:hypothetical protein
VSDSAFSVTQYAKPPHPLPLEGGSGQEKMDVKAGGAGGAEEATLMPASLRFMAGTVAAMEAWPARCA